MSAIREPEAACVPSQYDTADIQWLDVDAIADVSIMSAGRRVARVPPRWSNDSPGEQMIEIHFHERTSLRRVRIVSSEREQSRTQEMTIWASLHGGERHREVVRQQFNFSPDGATEEVEEYPLELEDVSTLQVRIVPSIDGRRAVARVTELRLAATAA